MNTPNSKSTQHHVPGNSAWENAWPLLRPTLKRSMGIQLLLVAAIGMLSATAGWRIAGALFLGSAIGEDTQVAAAEYLGQWPGNRAMASTPWQPRILGEFVASSGLPIPPADPILTPAFQFVAPVLGFFDREVGWRPWFYFLFGSIWSIISWGFFGTMICRMSVLQTAGNRNIDVLPAFRFAREKFSSTAFAGLVPLGAILLGMLPLMLLGSLMRINAGALLVGFVWPIAIVLGLCMAMLFLGFALGWPLMWSAIAAEGSDPFDAVSRAAAYTFQRPLRYAMYVLIVAGLGLFGWFLVWTISELAISFGFWGISWGAGDARTSAIAEASQGRGGGVGWGGSLIGIWVGLARTVASAYAYSFFWSAAAVIYLLLRFDVDSKEWDEVYQGLGNTTYGLTDITSD